MHLNSCRGIIGAMIILSVGMPRAGSGWFYNLTNDLMMANNAKDARQIRQTYRLQKILTEVNCNIGALTTRRLLAVLAPAALGNTFVIKAHSTPTPFARRLIQMGWMHTAYIYRDPRDAALSAFENGQRARQRGFTNAFSHLVDLDATIKFMQPYLHICEAWLGCEKVLHTRYEDLVTDYDSQAHKLVEFLQLDPASPANLQVVEKYRPESARSDQKGLHFSKGKIGRFRQKLSLEEQEKMNSAFAPYLQSLGFAL